MFDGRFAASGGWISHRPVRIAPRTFLRGRESLLDLACKIPACVDGFRSVADHR
jgi:hypothetical protein